MNIDERIELYREILEQDPQSKLFFSLAKLYREKEDIENAVFVLKKGIEIHPDHLEARLMLIDLLNKNGQEDSSEPHIKKLENLFKEYPMFWRSWASYLAKNGKKDLAGYISLIGAYFESKEEHKTLGEKIFDILKDVCWLEPKDKERSQLEEIVAVEQEQDLDLSSDKQDESCAQDVEFKTKTMADILMSQGDYKQAIEIYEELIKKEKDNLLKKELEIKLNEAKAKLASKKEVKENKSSHYKVKHKLLHRLKLLATRLEARYV